MNILFNKPKRQTCASLCIAVGLSLFATSCNTSSQSTRITELSGEFSNLSANDQKEVGKGAIAEGFTFEMVYMALGAPSDIETSADAMQTKWTYRNFYPSATATDMSIYRKPRRDPLQRTFRKWFNHSLSAQKANIMKIRQARTMPKKALGSPDMPASKLEIFYQEKTVSEYRINGLKS